MAAPPADKARLRAELTSLAQLLASTASMVSNFDEAESAVFEGQINKLIEGFKSVDEQREAYGHVMVPIEVLERLDKMEGDNDPSLYTKQTLERVVFDADALERTNAGCMRLVKALRTEGDGDAPGSNGDVEMTQGTRV